MNLSSINTTKTNLLDAATRIKDHARMQISKSLHTRFLFLCLAIIATIFVAPHTAAQTKRHLGPDDFYRMREVGDPQLSPDGKSIAYTVTTMNRELDRLETQIWTVDWEGTQSLQMTYGPESSSSPRWSPDGKYLLRSFLRTKMKREKGRRKSGCSIAAVVKRSRSPM